MCLPNKACCLIFEGDPHAVSDNPTEGIINPFLHATNLQLTTLKLSSQKYRKSLQMIV